MTMASFRADEVDARRAQVWAKRLGMDRSELLREALRRHLLLLASEQDVEARQAQPMTADESALIEIDDWGPTEDWADWADAVRSE